MPAMTDCEGRKVPARWVTFCWTTFDAWPELWEWLEEYRKTSPPHGNVLRLPCLPRVTGSAYFASDRGMFQADGVDGRGKKP